MAKGLGLAALPDRQPRVLKNVPKAEVTRSPALSLLARRGAAEGIKTRHVAIVVSEGANTDLATQVHARLTAQGAVPKFVGVRMGALGRSKSKLEVDGSLEIMPSVLWDGAIVLDSETTSLAENGQAVEFIKDQYRHSKTILFLGSARGLLGQLKLNESAKNGPVNGDAGLLSFAEDSASSALEAFAAALLQHRHFNRETDPPRV